MKEKIVILNIGIVSAIGFDANTCLRSLINKQSGIIDKPHQLKSKIMMPVGEIQASNKELIELIRLGLSPQEQKKINILRQNEIPRSALLSILAGLEAWHPFQTATAGLKKGIISANTVGGMDITEKHYQEYKEQSIDFNFACFQNHECSRITEWTQSFLGIQGWSTTVSTACSSSANSIMTAARLLEQNHLDIVLAGGVDALSSFTINGFNALKILDDNPCKPFDKDRKGLNLGEAAAYVVLCRESTAIKLKHRPIAFLSGYANSNDAFHQTASSPEGIGNQLAMENALKKAQLSMKDIDYINLHGTGTENNDYSEGKAIELVCQKQNHSEVPAASSTKTFTGHTLGAAGAVEAVFSCLAIQEQKIWPNLRWQNKIPELNWQPRQTLEEKNIKHVLSNSFGFGGNCSTLILSKY